jgi:hypothetical protein
MPKMIFVNLPVTDLDASMTFYKSIGFEKQCSPHRRYGRVHGMERGDQRHAAHTPQVAQVHEPPHPARNVERSDACPVLRQSPGGRCHERGGCRDGLGFLLTVYSLVVDILKHTADSVAAGVAACRLMSSRYLFQLVERQQKFTINCARSNCHNRATTDFNSPRLLAREKQ